MSRPRPFGLILIVFTSFLGASSAVEAQRIEKQSVGALSSVYASAKTWQLGAKYDSLPRGGTKGLESLAVAETWFFGSSTTDTGNLQAVALVFPEPPYYQGRASNGPVWAEYFSDLLGTSANPSLFGGTNYAWSAARTTEVAFGFIPPIEAQVDTYLNDVSFVADPDALYVFQNAANDLTAAKLEPPDTAKQTMQEAVAATREMLTELYEAGARNFMLITIPELPTAPVSADLPDDTNLARLTNSGFEKIADNLRAMGANVWVVDLHALVNDAVKDADRYGLEVVRCSFMGKSSLEVIGGDVTPEPCEPSVPVDEYMMFDDEHYTTVMHNIVAHQALSQLCAGQWPTDVSSLRPCVVIP